LVAPLRPFFRFSGVIAVWNGLFLLLALGAFGLITSVFLYALLTNHGTGHPYPTGSFNAGVYVGALLSVVEAPIFVARGAVLLTYSLLSRTSGIRSLAGSTVVYGVMLSLALVVLVVAIVTSACSIVGCSGAD
jgi:hypothetical protein